MEIFNINISVEQYAELSELNDSDRNVVEGAIKATELSYSPYSHFCVGACLELKNGALIMGANQENASYPVTICAERSALSAASSQYPGIAPVRLAIAAKNKQILTPLPISPCGMCRQALNEHEIRYSQPIRILLFGTTKIYAVNTVKNLLPLSFDDIK